MLHKHKLLGLNMGLVKENFAIVKKSDKYRWEARGFKRIRKYPIFRYRPNSSEIIMLGIPLYIEEFGTEALKGSRVTDASICHGTYGMGGPGFFGLKLQGEYGIRWLIYCIWAAGEHILFDDNILQCHGNYTERYNPLIVFEEDLEKFERTMLDMIIKEVKISKECIEIILVDSHGVLHSIKSYKSSERFPEQGGTGEKRNSFETGEMKDYWLIIHDESDLKV